VNEVEAGKEKGRCEDDTGPVGEEKIPSDIARRAGLMD
jgi:hypothetical protein